MTNPKNAVEMYSELLNMNYINLNTSEPSVLMEPTAYTNIDTAMDFYTPPISVQSLKMNKVTQDAKLVRRIKRNSKRKR